MAEVAQDRAEIGRRLREARKARGLTQGEVGRTLGVSATQIWKYETGRSGMSLTHLRALRDRLGIEPRELLPDDGAEAAAREVTALVAEISGLLRRLREIAGR